MLFLIGDSVYVKLQPYRQQSLKSSSSHKLSPKLYGPFRILDKMGAVSYKLELPPSAKIHNVFHVSQLKRSTTNPTEPASLPQFLLDVGKSLEPDAILDRKMVKRMNESVTKVLVQ